MKKDLSLELYEKYFSMKNRNITVATKNNETFHGTFISFIKGDVEWGENYILKWRFSFADENERDIFIEQKNIQAVHFEEDDSQLNF